VLAEIRGRQATLRRLREARALTQSAMADLLDMDQSEVSRLERRGDMLLSTLKRFVEATGGEVHIIVDYPDGGPVELLVGDE
jgi:transcriptional regulator with XRE-family HTH domain